MKKLLKLFAILFLLLFFVPTTEAQIFKKLEKKVKTKVNNRVDKKADKKIDEGLDEVEGVGKNTDKNGGSKDVTTSSSAGNIGGKEKDNVEENGFSYSSKFDFVPGDKILLHEAFENDAIGDFPASWNTNGSGETVKLSNQEGNWLKMKSGSIFIPDLSKDLPDDLTLEFDLYAAGLSQQTSSGAKVGVYLSESKKLTLYDNNYIFFDIPFCQYINVGITAFNKVAADKDAYVRSVLKVDLRKKVLNKVHISVAANKQRLRVWVNEEKEIDIPRLAPNYKMLNYVKFVPKGFKDETEDIFISNIRLAEAGEDIRSQLEKNGKYTTNGILFASNSSTILPESAGIIKELAVVLQSNAKMKIKITGHTDSDGSTESNLTLSKQRATAVKEALTSKYSISSERLMTDGKGESEPVADNGTPLGKAQNRRVFFEKM